MSRRKELLTRSLTGIVIVALTVGAILYSPWSYLGLLCCIAWVGSFEFTRLRLTEAGDNIFLVQILLPLILAMTTAYAGYVLLHDGNPLRLLLMLLVSGHAFFLLLSAFSKGPGELVRNTIAVYSGISYLGLSVMSGCIFFIGGYTWQYVLLPVILIWLNDTGAYLAGTWWGKRKIAPALSPGKTWEGTIGGGVAVVLAGIILAKTWPELSPGYVIMISLATPLLALGGDLWESALKRQAGVKDSGRIFPGHGGVLDRYDSFLFVLPVAALAYLIFAA